VVRELVAVGLSVNDGCRGTGYTPLHLSAAGGHVVVCELLLDALADVHKQVDGITALSLARKMGNVEVEEVIERHVATLLMQDQGNAADEAAQYRRAHVLPRVSAMLSEAVLQAAPFEETPANRHDELEASTSQVAQPFGIDTSASVDRLRSGPEVQREGVDALPHSESDKTDEIAPASRLPAVQDPQPL